MWYVGLLFYECKDWKTNICILCPLDEKLIEKIIILKIFNRNHINICIQKKIIILTIVHYQI